MYYLTKDLSFSTVRAIAVSIKKILNKGQSEELAELNNRIDCLQLAVANLTRLVSEDLSRRRPRYE
jgi:hypothetical protein